jgi:phosphomannomutase
MLRALGAVVYAPSEWRSDTFVPIDTEAMSAARLDELQRIADGARRVHGRIDAIVSTDGDSDRPLVVGVDDASGAVRFVGGDLLGVVVADWLAATSRRRADQHQRRRRRAAGAPRRLRRQDQDRLALRRQARCSTPRRTGTRARSSAGRPTAAFWSARRLCAARAHARAAADARRRAADCRLPARQRRAAALARRALRRAAGALQQGRPARQLSARLGAGAAGAVRAPGAASNDLDVCRRRPAARRTRAAFTAADGFSAPVRVDWTDGVRVWFANGDIAHIRPSGNAPQLRIYAVADTQARADDIVRRAVREPDGILRKLEAQDRRATVIINEALCEQKQLFNQTSIAAAAGIGT